MHFFPHLTFVHIHFHLHFCFNIWFFFFEVIGVLSIISVVAPPFQKKIENCHVAHVIISQMGGVHCNVCHSKSMVQNSSFLHDSITTNDEHVLLTIEGKWFKTIVHITKVEFLDFPYLKQVQLLISIHIHGKF